MGGCCSNGDAKARKKELGKVDPDKQPHIRTSSKSGSGTNGGEYSVSSMAEPSFSDSSMTYDTKSQMRAKTIVTDFGFKIGIELDDIASFLDDIRATDKKRENDPSKKRKMDGMDRIWYGCVGSSSKNKEQIEEIETPQQLNRLLYKLTYVTLNTFNKSKKVNKNSIKAKPDKKAVEACLIPVKRAILKLKYNKEVNFGDPELNRNVVLTREEFKQHFPKYLRQASTYMQESEDQN